MNAKQRLQKRREHTKSDFIYGTELAKLSGRVESGFIYLITDFHESDSEILGFPVQAKQGLIKWLQQIKTNDEV